MSSAGERKQPADGADPRLDDRGYDGLIVVSFGGPEGPDDVIPFLENVTRGRGIPRERLAEVGHHYDLFGGVSPINRQNRELISTVEAELTAHGIELPVYLGNRNWHPYLVDTLTTMSTRGVRRAIGILAAAQRTYSGCLQYKENVRDARAALSRNGSHDVEIVYVSDWHEHPGFVEANADQVRQAFERLPADKRDRARLIFTAHSVPTTMAAQYPYERQLRASAALIANAVFSDPRTLRVPPTDWTLVYQSRSGRPGDPWLEPDVCEYLRAAREQGLDAAVLCPVGFLCDHVEVLYDLDVEAAQLCQESGIAMERASAVNVHPRFIDALADAVTDVWRRYVGKRPVAVGTL